MFKIVSYIKRPNMIIKNLEEAKIYPHKYFVEAKNLVELQRYSSNVDCNYIDGVIYIEYNGQVLMDYSFWDLVDQLWAYFLNIIEGYIQNGNSKTYFPDSPTEIRFEKISAELLLFQITTQTVSKWTLPKKEFFNTLLDGARDFFENMSELFGSNVDYSYELNKINELKALVN